MHLSIAPAKIVLPCQLSQSCAPLIFACWQSERLKGLAEESVAPSEAAEVLAAKAKQDLDEATAALQIVLQSIASSNGTMGSAAQENKDAAARVVDTEKTLEEARIALRKLGGSGAGSGEAAPPDMSHMPGPDEGEPGSKKSLAVENIKKTELDEVRKLTRPPEVVRRALEMVQIMLKMSDGVEVDISKKEEVPWSELQTMIADGKFIKRVLQMKPLSMSMKPEQLSQAVERWPGLLDAVGSKAAPRLLQKLGGGNTKSSTSNLKSKLLISKSCLERLPDIGNPR